MYTDNYPSKKKRAKQCKMQIEFQDIHKHYGPVRANNGISLTVAPGTIHGILGENGAGKSTLMKILAGYIRKTDGKILINGSPVAYATPAQAAFARGIAPQRLQLFYAVCGGLLVGLAGATFSLSTKPGWGRPQGAEGTGWIALALVIFGGWNPVKTALGAYLFSFLQVLGIYFQGWLPSIPAQVFQVAPFPLMIFTLVLRHLAQKESTLNWAGGSTWKNTLLRIFVGTAPAALGKPHRTD